MPRLLVFPFGLVALFGLAAVLYNSDLVLRLAHCPLRDLTGLPCPTCGGTHAAISLAHGRLTEAFAASPLIAGGLILFSVWVMAGVATTLVPAWRRELVFSPREKRTARVLAVLMAVAGWVWVIARSPG
ncbi:MAG: DUF2752 domain-containing protein [Candidatus Krumholzibacteriota bacterium]